MSYGKCRCVLTALLASPLLHIVHLPAMTAINSVCENNVSILLMKDHTLLVYTSEVIKEDKQQKKWNSIIPCKKSVSLSYSHRGLSKFKNHKTKPPSPTDTQQANGAMLVDLHMHHEFERQALSYNACSLHSIQQQSAY